MTLPTAEDFGDGLDERVARKHFLGRTLAEAQAVLRQQPHLYYEDLLWNYEDLLWMGPVAFRYYFPAAVSALLDGAADGDLYPLASFAGTLENRLATEPEELRPAAGSLAAACRVLFVTFEDTIIEEADIYGELHSRYPALEEAFTRLAA